MEDVSLLKLYVTIVFIETGRKVSTGPSFKVSKREREYLIEHFGLTKNPATRRFSAPANTVFEILKSDYPEYMDKNNIDSYSTLYNKILIAKGF